jgi:glycosyltransferase involved in cell wall biosynthesis
VTLPDEIVVVDDGGDDGCDKLVREFPDLPINYVYTHNPAFSLCSYARNVGVKIASHDVIIMSEPEILLVDDGIQRLLKHHTETPEFVVQAGTLHWIDPIYSAEYKGGPVDLKRATTAQFGVCNALVLYRKSWLLDVGGWDEEFPEPYGWEDIDLFTRLRIAGHNQICDPDIQIVHQWHKPSTRPAHKNHARYINKGFHIDERPDHPDLVANRGLEWGRIIPRQS